MGSIYNCTYVRSTRTTTGEPRFPECRTLPRVPKIGHSGKQIFPECCTRGRKALGEERLSRVPQNPWHSGKDDSWGRVALTKGNSHLTTPLDGTVCQKKMKNVFPECHALALGEDGIFPECHAEALGEIFLFF
jgi:hypothetical protein